LLLFLEAARAIPPAAPASAAPPATSGTFALPAALPTVFPALFALPPAPSTAWRTASTLECFAPEPFERDLAFAPLLELRALLLADFALAFAAFGFGALAFEADFGFDDDFVADDFARFGADRFFGLVFA
jgi:hypothetical protein